MTIDQQNDATLTELLRARAMRASPRRLQADMVGGVAVVAWCAWFRPLGWVAFVSTGLCFALYGMWAIAERHVHGSTFETSTAVTRRWQLVRAVAAMLGVLSLFVLLASVMVRTLGRWMS